MQILINGILLGAIYALLGVGMSMMFGIVKLTNLAHGEFIIMGAFGSTILSSALGINPILTLVVTVPVMFLLGMVLQSVLINRVMLRGAEPALLVTFGLSIILKDAMLLLFTADAQKIGVSYATASLNLGGISISVLNLVVFAISLITILVLTLFLRKTYMGRAIRATSDDTVAASLMGVSVKKTYGVAMGIAMATAAIAGLCVGMRWTFYPSSGGEYLLIAFGVVVIGGMGSIPGTLVAGLVFGLAQVIGGANYGMFISYIVLLVMLAVRPQGQGRAQHAAYGKARPVGGAVGEGHDRQGISGDPDKGLLAQTCHAGVTAHQVPHGAQAAVQKDLEQVALGVAGEHSGQGQDHQQRHNDHGGDEHGQAAEHTDLLVGGGF